MSGFDAFCGSAGMTAATHRYHCIDDFTVLRGVVGSSAYLGMDSGSDRDEMGVFIEAPEHVVGQHCRDRRVPRQRLLGYVGK